MTNTMFPFVMLLMVTHAKYLLFFYLSFCVVSQFHSLLRKRSYGFVTQSFLPHERLLQPVATSVRANWPITGRLPIFVKQDFDRKFISRIHVNMANVAAVFDLVAQKFFIRELNALQKEAIIQFVEKQREVFLQKEVDRPTRLLQVVAFVHLYICRFLFGVSTFFVASLLFRKGTSFCVVRRK